jgi:hypothetical protein
MGWGWSDEWSQQLGWSSSDHPVVVWLVTVVGYWVSLWLFVAVGLYGSRGRCFVGFVVALVLGLVVGSIAGSLEEFLVGSSCWLRGRSIAATVGGLVPGGSADYWVLDRLLVVRLIFACLAGRFILVRPPD